MVDEGDKEHDPREDLRIEMRKRTYRDKPSMVENSTDFANLVVPASKFLKENARKRKEEIRKH